MTIESNADALAHVREAESILREAQRALNKAKQALRIEVPEVPDEFDPIVIPPHVSSQANRIRQVLGIIQARLAATPERKFATLAEILQDGVAAGLDAPAIHQALETLVRNNSLYHRGGKDTYCPLLL